MENENKLYVWGTGAVAVGLNIRFPDELQNIDGYIDNAVDKQNGEFFNKHIFSPDILNKQDKAKVCVYLAVSEKDEIIEQLNKKFYGVSITVLGENYFKEKYMEVMKNKILLRYRDTDDPEIKEILVYLKSHKLDFFNYNFREKYEEFDCEVFFEDGFFYLMHHGKKLFMSPKYNTKEKVLQYYRSLLLEQEATSPHRYCTDSFNVSSNAVVIDGGAAEGMFSLDVIDRVRKIYMFESDKAWCEALTKTFEKYKEKVMIINKAISNYTDNDTLKIDDLIEAESIDFIKLDIEGEEFYALEGAERLIKRSPKIRCAVCTYHQEHAYYAIKQRLEEMGLECTNSTGYMWFREHFNKMRAPVLRRGLIRAEKEW